VTPSLSSFYHQKPGLSGQVSPATSGIGDFQCHGILEKWNAGILGLVECDLISF
jgi:hypothetical protein